MITREPLCSFILDENIMGKKSYIFTTIVSVVYFVVTRTALYPAPPTRTAPHNSRTLFLPRAAPHLALSSSAARSRRP